MPSFELAEGASQAEAASAVVEWEVSRPGTWNAFVGGLITISTEMLQEMADRYDPAVLEASVNFDHERWGPSHGWVRSLRFDGSSLFATVADLSDELVAGVRDRRWRRVSSEMNLMRFGEAEEAWYLTGLGVLGAAAPAVRGMRPIAAAGESAVLIHLSSSETPEDIGTDAGSSTIEPPDPPGEETPVEPPQEPTTPTQGDTMPGTVPTTTGAGTQPGAQPTGPAPAPATPATQTQPPAGGDLEAQLASARATNAELSTLLASARERDAEARVERDLAALGGRVTPAELPHLRATMIGLAAKPTPATIKLAGPPDASGHATEIEACEYDALVASLRARPDILAALGGELATQDGDAPIARNLAGADERRIALAHGITEEQQIGLQRKYPGGYRDQTGRPN
jgi:hypothetical protein